MAALLRESEIPVNPSLRPLRPKPRYATVPAMDIHIPDNRPTADQRMQEDQVRKTPPLLDLSQGKSPLARALNPIQANWLIKHACDRWWTLWNDLAVWRAKMIRWEEMSEGIYTSRVGAPNNTDPQYKKDVFSYCNDTMGVSEANVDFVAAQAINDLFGTDPWIAATPDGPGDSNEEVDMADIVSKHLSWKLGQSNMERAIKDAVKMAVWGGTSFVKPAWRHFTETYTKADTVAFQKSTNAPLTAPGGDYWRDKESLQAFMTNPDTPPELLVDGSDIEWREMDSEQTVTVLRNVDTSILDFKDVAFDQTQPYLNLMFTDFYSRVRMGLLDVAALYGLTEEQTQLLRMAYAHPDEEVRYRRGETAISMRSTFGSEMEANPQVSFVEGYMRCDPLNNGNPIRIHYVFSPELYACFALDYLPNITPDGILPVFPIRVFKLPRRILGRGYFEKYENANNAIDRMYCASVYRNELGSHVISAIDKSQFLKPDDIASKNFMADTRVPVELTPDGALQKAVQFLPIPVSEAMSEKLMNQRLQMVQMASGVISPATGELPGVPSTNTATGDNILETRSAILVKDPIDQMVEDIQPAVELAAFLIYDNQDVDETFRWGEGKESELMKIKAGDVQGMRAKISLTLVQSQNKQKLAAANQAISAALQYVNVPETDKINLRPLFVQAISSLGFHNADQIIREGITNPAGLLAMLPPEQQPAMQAAMESAGLLQPPAPVDASGMPVEGDQAAAGPSDQNAQPPLPQAQPVAIPTTPDNPPSAPVMQAQ